MLHSICQQIWKTQQWPQDWKMSVFIPVPMKGNGKDCSDYLMPIVLISHAVKVMLKILQARLQQYMNHDFQMSSWIYKRQRNQQSNFQHPLDHRKSKRVPEKYLLCFIDDAKAFDCVHHNKFWKILEEMGVLDHLICLLRNLYAGQQATARTGYGTTDWFQIRKG